MSDQPRGHRPDNLRHSDPRARSDGEVLTRRLAVGAGLALGLTALVVLAYAGGSLNFTSTGVTIAVNARP